MQGGGACGVCLDGGEGEMGDREEGNDERQWEDELAEAVGRFEGAGVGDLLVTIARGTDIAGIDVMLLHRRGLV